MREFGRRFRTDGSVDRLYVTNMILFGNCNRGYGGFSSTRAECAPRSDVGAYGPRRIRIRLLAGPPMAQI